MAIKHILKLILKQKSIALLIILQIAITVMIVSNTVFISYATLQNWLIPSKLEEQQILNVTTRVFDTLGRRAVTYRKGYSSDRKCAEGRCRILCW